MESLCGSLSTFVEKLLKNSFPGCRFRVVERAGVSDLVSLVHELDGKACLIVKNVEVPGLPCTVGVVAHAMHSRECLYSILGAKSDEQAYERLTALLQAPQPLRIIDVEFEEWYDEVKWPLSALPSLRLYEGELAPYISSSIVVACYGETCNASIHRIMVLSDERGVVRVSPRHLYALLERAGGSIPVAVVLGVDPRVLLAASSSPPFGVFELPLASSLLGCSLPFCRTPRYGIPVPCTAALVLEGVLGPEKEVEGPYVDVLELYDQPRPQPVFKLEAAYLTKRGRPWLNIILPGGLEHKLLMGFPKEAEIYRHVKRVVPGVSKVRLTLASGMWLHAVISVKKGHEGDGKLAGLAAISAHPSLKHVVVVDDDVNVDDPRDIEWAIATRFRADRDLTVITNVRGSTLDPTSPDGLSAKMILDATAPLAERSKFRRLERLMKE